MLGVEHVDFLDEVQQRPENQRPVSVIVALNPFEFIYLPDPRVVRSDLKTTTVGAGNMIAFTSECFHAGGENNTRDWVLRLFAYLVLG